MQLSASLIYFIFVVEHASGVKLPNDATFRSVVKTSETTGAASATMLRSPKLYLSALQLSKRQCGVCQLGGHKAGKLFLKGRSDGTGSRAKALVDALAFAAKTGMNFGGALVEKGLPEHQRGNTTNITRMLDTLLGSSQWAVLEIPQAKEWEVCGQGNLFLPSFVNGFIKEKSREQNVFLKDADNCFLWGAEAYKYYSGGPSLYTPQFLQTFRAATALPTYRDLFGDTRRPVVAIHLRREDVSFGDVDRVTPDIVYYNLISKIRKHLPDADVHVFAGQKCVFCPQNQWEPVDFEGYKAQGMTLHLDEDPLVAWAHFARADVMAMSKSSFSFVPALLNPNCVVYQPYWHQPLDEWMVISGEQAEVKDDDLRKCLNRIQGRKKLQ